MNPEKLINWGELSRLLAGSRSVITKKRIGEKHKQPISDLLSLIKNWHSLHYNFEEEIWKDIQDYEGLYRISNKGRVFNCVNKNYYPKDILNPSRGYISYPLKKGGKTKTTYIHRLVAIHFIPNPDNKKCVNHKNRIQGDNRVENLEWCTYS